MPFSSVSTAAASVQSPVRDPQRYDRVFYSGMAMLMALTVFAGSPRSWWWSAFRPRSRRRRWVPLRPDSIFASVPARLALSGTAGWRAFAELLVG